ncbi:hypothetical protein PIB30_092592 [Stylosanthes scabra]|uniref:Uncharacterized protein n=1 Tax=Stylosanthes scabra TaxID=79078 RepID=A0ABU6QV15_9FABA|nr:hypothetical protein [Stylosanthes scabra]
MQQDENEAKYVNKDEQQHEQPYMHFKAPNADFHNTFQEQEQQEYVEELKAFKTRQDELWSNQNNLYQTMRTQQGEMAKEIEEIKKFQVNQTLIGFRANPIKKLEERMLKHRNEIIEMRAQIKEWTKNVSSREAYCCWAHQQANLNLVEIPTHKIPEFVHDNAAKGKHFFHGALKSHQQGEPSQPANQPMAETEKE